jgi:hypothetical protein
MNIIIVNSKDIFIRKKTERKFQALYIDENMIVRYIIGELTSFDTQQGGANNDRQH